MKKTVFLFSFVTSIAMLVALPAAKAIEAPDLVTPADTFSFDIGGFNSASGVGYLLTPDETATFGTTQTFVAAGINGQDITITSSETIGANSTTDTFTVTTPTNFLTTKSVNGTTITAMEFDLGNDNSGSDMVSLELPIRSYTSTGGIIYGPGNFQNALTPGVTLGTGRMSYSAAEAASNDTTAVSDLAIHQFTFSITYTNAVPEPSTWALVGIGLIAGAVTVRHRKVV